MYRLTNMTHRNPLSRKRITVAIKTVTGYAVIRAGHSITVNDTVYQENKHRTSLIDDPTKWSRGCVLLGECLDKNVKEKKEETITIPPVDVPPSDITEEEEAPIVEDNEEIHGQKVGEDDLSESETEKIIIDPVDQSIINEMISLLEKSRTHKQVADFIENFKIETPEGYESMKVSEKIEALKAIITTVSVSG